MVFDMSKKYQWYDVYICIYDDESYAIFIVLYVILDK